MKHIFKRLLTLSLAALLCAGVMFANTATVHAEDDPYDFSTHESGGGYYFMDNYHGYECSVLFLKIWKK